MSRSPRIVSWSASAALALALLLPHSPAPAATDCSSLDIELASSAQFSNVECDTGGSRYGDASHSEEVITATSDSSLFVIQHYNAGVRTYFDRGDTRKMIEGSGAFSKTGQWATGPGGDRFMVMKFAGSLTNSPSLPLECFGFSRFTGHVAHSTGYRHIIFGFYCAAQPGAVPDAEVRRLLGDLTYDFE